MILRHTETLLLGQQEVTELCTIAGVETDVSNSDSSKAVVVESVAISVLYG